MFVALPEHSETEADQEDWVDGVAEEKLDLEAEKARQARQKNEERPKYASHFMLVASLSLSYVGLMSMLTGDTTNRFELSDTVLIALLGTALSTVLAPAILLARYLFGDNGDEKDRG